MEKFACTVITIVCTLVSGTTLSSALSRTSNDYFRFELRPEKNFSISVDHKNKLANYFALFQESKRIEKICETKASAQFASVNAREQVSLSFLSTLQEMGINITTNAIGYYAKKLDFTDQEFSGLVNSIIGNFCSPNMAIYTNEDIKKRLFDSYNQDISSRPTIIDETLLPDEIKKVNTTEGIIERELNHTIQAFRAFCSWGRDVDDLRLLIPFLKNPAVSVLVTRELTAKKVIWRQHDNSAVEVDDLSNNKQFFCENFICTKESTRDFRDKIQKFVGRTSLRESFEWLYCDDYKNAAFNYHNQLSQITNWYESMSLEDQELMVLQFIALMTSVPDLFVRLEKYSDAKEYLKMSIKENWDRWTRDILSDFTGTMEYEEQLTVEKVDSENYFDRFKKNFQVVLDVNFGEFDRGSFMIGKLPVVYTIELPKKYLYWARNKWSEAKASDDMSANVKIILDNFKLFIDGKISEFASNLIIAPWKGDLSNIVAKEILNQVIEVDRSYFEKNDNELVKIPVKLYYSPFALQYIRNEYLSNKGINYLNELLLYRTSIKKE